MRCCEYTFNCTQNITKQRLSPGEKTIYRIMTAVSGGEHYVFLDHHLHQTNTAIIPHPNKDVDPEEHPTQQNNTRRMWWSRPAVTLPKWPRSHLLIKIHSFWLNGVSQSHLLIKLMTHLRLSCRKTQFRDLKRYKYILFQLITRKCIYFLR